MQIDVRLFRLNKYREQQKNPVLIGSDYRQEQGINQHLPIVEIKTAITFSKQI